MNNINKNFKTSENAKQYLDGVSEWEFTGEASFDGLVEYACLHGDTIADELFSEEDEISSEEDEDFKNTIIAEYLKSVNENPTDYSIRV